MADLCSVVACDRPQHSRGWCITHYARWRNTGDVQASTPVRQRGGDPLRRFMRQVDTSGGIDDCWPWTGQQYDKSQGYGKFFADGAAHRAHRWILAHTLGRELTSKEFALHRCDNDTCVNPRHLYVGDHAQNMQDVVERRRHRAHRQTYCKHGHKFTPENTRITKGTRHCRACHRERSRVHRARAGEAA